jgi:hypothetical protein
VKKLTCHSAKRNATASPLLRLPPEIRNKIWGFAMGGQLVVLPDEDDSKGCAMRIKVKDDCTGDIPLTFRTHLEATKLRAAFHLPEVCRQVYSETVLTSYRENVFLCGSVYPTIKMSFGRLKAAQRKAITAVEFNPLVLYCHVKPNPETKPVTSALPNIKFISVSSVALRDVQRLCKLIHGDDTEVAGLRGKAMWQMWLRKKLAGIYGDGMRVHFEG